MNLLLELRETAKACPKPNAVKMLRDAADELDMALSALVLAPTQAALQRVNGAWAHGVRVLGSAPPLGGDGAQGGAIRLTDEQRMAA